MKAIASHTMGNNMKITNTEIFGFVPALRGMRNPMNSWYLRDTIPCVSNKYNSIEILWDCTEIGPKDMDLAKRLIKAGPEHCKFLRQIQVWADFDMPLYWWSEFDTYKFNTKNSCSTMHKLLNNKEEITIDNFVYDREDKVFMQVIVDQLNYLRHHYLESKDYSYVIRAKKLLPTSYKQLRTVNTNYAELINIYHQRKNHRLKEEWQDIFCRWVEGLPYMNEFLNIK
jgi:hypothetical protein